MRIAGAEKHGQHDGGHARNEHAPGGLPLFPYDTDTHEAAWVVQRIWKKRMLRRSVAQAHIVRAFRGWYQRREFFIFREAVRHAAARAGNEAEVRAESPMNAPL